MAIEKEIKCPTCESKDIVKRGKQKLKLDFKPEAAKEKYASVQLYLYALGLSFRTKIPLSSFRCAWFDDSIYNEFVPSEVSIKGWGKYAYAARSG